MRQTSRTLTHVGACNRRCDPYLHNIHDHLDETAATGPDLLWSANNLFSLSSLARFPVRFSRRENAFRRETARHLPLPPSSTHPERYHWARRRVQKSLWRSLHQTRMRCKHRDNIGGTDTSQGARHTLQPPRQKLPSVFGTGGAHSHTTHHNVCIG